MSVKQEALVRLFAVLVFIKITGFIAINWWVVTAPLWVPCAYLTVCFALFVLAEEGLR